MEFELLMLIAFVVPLALVPWITRRISLRALLLLTAALATLLGLGLIETF